MVAGIRSYLAAIDSDLEKYVQKGSIILPSELLVTKGLWVTGDLTWEFSFKKILAS